MRSVDLTAAARIRAAALRRFPEHGFEGTTVRVIAEDAGTSPALVLHHYGSKAGLRRACDTYVVDQIRTVKEEAISSGRLADPAMMAGGFRVAEPLMRYLSWALASGSDAAAELFDELVEESVRLFGMAEESGVINPSPDPRARSAVLLAMQMGALVMRDHLERALGVDPLGTEGVMLMSRVILELLSGSMFAAGYAVEIQRALDIAIEDTRRETHDG